MKTRLELAHEWYMKHSRGVLHINSDIVDAWQYADAMLAENEKRKSKTTLTTLQQTFINGVEQPRYAPCVEEWQPDWSVAPEWANWWAMDLDNNQAHWFEVEPIIDGISWYRRTRVCKQSSDFNYQGNWRDSLRKRPEGK